MPHGQDARATVGGDGEAAAQGRLAMGHEWTSDMGPCGRRSSVAGVRLGDRSRISVASVLRLVHAHGFAYNLRPEGKDTAMEIITYSDSSTAFGEIMAATGTMAEVF